MEAFEAAMDYLLNRLPMFQRSGPAVYKHSLVTSLALDELYGHPHRHYATLHIAGTNGKGSVSHMLASVLQAAGYRTGLFTSPHLTGFRERIRVNGEMIPREQVATWVGDFLRRNGSAGLEPSFFELTAEMALCYFADAGVDIAVVETGLGGRLDSTNVITPLVSVITNIGHDHMPLLGSSLEEVAAEKAGIIKPGVPVVIGQYQEATAPLFLAAAAAQGSPCWFACREYQAERLAAGGEGLTHYRVFRSGELRYARLGTDLGGGYQRLNLPPVLMTLELLRTMGWKLPMEAETEGLASVGRRTGLRGRWQVLGRKPLVICDTGHNEEGIREVVAQIRNTPHRELHMVFGVVSDKDVSAMLALLPPEAHYYFTRASVPRALDARLLQEQAANAGLRGEAFPTVEEAFRAARRNAHPEDLLFAGGSNFIVADLLELLFPGDPQVPSTP